MVMLRCQGDSITVLTFRIPVFKDYLKDTFIIIKSKKRYTKYLDLAFIVTIIILYPLYYLYIILHIRPLGYGAMVLYT